MFHLKEVFMSDSLQLLYVMDADRQVQAVQIPWELWRRIEPLARPALDSLMAKASEEPAEPLAAFAEFLHYWDFSYAYSPAVRCPHCGAATQNWREDQAHPFRLANANLGGLLVFHCRDCGATIRQKHFRDHVAVEHTPPNA